MTLNDNSSLYDILELKPDASPQEVREAYLRTKSAYNKDSVALYTLISTEEREEMLSAIESAYDVLSNADRRKEYDRHHGLLEFDQDDLPTRVPINKKIISIDRVPPMENSPNSEALLIAPTTDFPSDRRRSSDQDFFGAAEISTQANLTDSPSLPSSGPTSAGPQTSLPVEPLQANAASSVASPPAIDANQAPKRPLRSQEAALAQEIAQEVEWKGSFLRKIREARRTSVEEMSSITKVSKTYLLAIEEENFPKLPAAVFLRGFITQIAKTLKLPHDAVVAAYMARFQQSRPDKNAR